MKKIMNEPNQLITQMCHGMVLSNPELTWNEKYRFITRREKNPGKVCLISGGGSGHEPAHAGFVGKGMLDGAVCGDVFASPSQIQIYQAIREAAGDKGVLLIIKNYSGDMMNFKNAAYLASEDGIRVEYVKVDDDIAVKDSLYTVGRRGVAGTVFVHKAAGAAAERGYELEQVKKIAEKTAASVKTIGFALSSCTVPAKGTPIFSLKEDEMEYGIGIHGEPGVRREQVLTADELAERMTDELLLELGIQESEKAEIALLINGLGGTPLQELYVLNHSVRAALEKRNITVKADFTGNYMTSLEMAGASVSILRLDEELEELLLEPCETPAFTITGKKEAVPYTDLHLYSSKKECCSYTIETEEHFREIGTEITRDNIVYMVDCMSQCIIENEQAFCELDSFAGDGDFGMSVAKGFRKLKEEWKNLIKEQDTGEFLNGCSMVIMEYCGGASGPVWGSAFRAAGRKLKGKTSVTQKEFADMLQAAVSGIQKTGERSFGRGAAVGDKTLIDALVPCADTWSRLAGTGEKTLTVFKKAAKETVAGAKSTEDIVARMGRAGTVGKRSLGHPDAGAYALGIIFTEISGRLIEKP